MKESNDTKLKVYSRNRVPAVKEKEIVCVRTVECSSQVCRKISNRKVSSYLRTL